MFTGENHALTDLKDGVWTNDVCLFFKLAPAWFMRVHRSYIIPLKDICSIRNKHIYFRDFKIPVGDTYLEIVQQWLSGLQ